MGTTPTSALFLSVILLLVVYLTVTKHDQMNSRPAALPAEQPTSDAQKSLALEGMKTPLRGKPGQLDR
jgi:hypothetical protein